MASIQAGTFMKSEDYKGKHDGIQGKVFEPFNRRGYCSIPVLEFLKGREWNDVALAYVHALRPTRIRVIEDGRTQMNSENWRVTIYLAEDKTIKSLFQEVEVGLPEGYESSYEFINICRVKSSK